LDVCVHLGDGGGAGGTACKLIGIQPCALGGGFQQRVVGLRRKGVLSFKDAGGELEECFVRLLLRAGGEGGCLERRGMDVDQRKELKDHMSLGKVVDDLVHD